MAALLSLKPLLQNTLPRNAGPEKDIWVCRELWAQIYKMLEVKLLEVDELKLQRAKAHAVHRHAAEQRQIQQLEDEDQWQQKYRTLEVAVRDL